MRGQKHLIFCRCILSQFKGRQNPPRHQFSVFSSITDDDNVIVKYAQCNNCGLVHKVTDICKSEIMQGKEAMSSILTIDDIKLSLPPNLANILERNKSDLATWEQALFIIENKEWGNFILLAAEEDSGVKQIKYIRVMSESFFKIENFSREDVAQPLEK